MNKNHPVIEDMTLDQLTKELETVDRTHRPTDYARVCQAYNDRIERLAEHAQDFLDGLVRGINFEQFDDATRENISRDEVPEIERRMIHALLSKAQVPREFDDEEIRATVEGQA